MDEHEKQRHRVPAWCPVCDYTFRLKEDSTMYRRFGCCVNCHIAFVEDREDRWREGWRPTQEQVDSYYNRTSK